MRVSRARHAEVYGHEFRASERFPDRCIPCGTAANLKRARESGVKPPHRRADHRAKYGHEFVERRASSTCLVCHREAMRKRYRESHGLDPNEPRQDWQTAHEIRHGHKQQPFRSGKAGCAECASIYTRKRYRENAVRLRQERVKAYWADPVRARRRQREWKRANPEAVQRIQRRLTISRRLHGDREGLTYALFIANDPCSYCGRAANTIDHIEPVFNGGSHGPDNLTAACESCNSSKRDRPLLLFLLHRRRAA